LFAQISDADKMTLRVGTQLKLTGSLENVAVRPSTGLKLRETPETVYRVLAFTTASDDNGPFEVQATAGDPGIIQVLATVTTIATNVCTTDGNHKLALGDKFIPTSTANGFTSGVTYYIISVPNYNQFTVSTSPTGSAATVSNGTGLSIKGIKTP